MLERAHQLILGDCLEVMKDIPNGSVDMLLVDLPYGTIQCSWDSIIPFEPLWDAILRVCKKTAPLVFTASQPFTTKLINSNIKIFKYEWIWVKSRPNGFLNAKLMPMKKHENIVVFCQSKVVYNPQDLVLKDKQKKIPE